MAATTEKAKASAKARPSDVAEKLVPDEHQPSSEIPATQAELEQVRDILFGAQLREQKRGLADFAASVETRIDQLRGTTDHAFQSLNERVESETKRIDQALVDESDRRSQEVVALREELERLKTLIHNVRDAASASLVELRHSVEEQFGQLRHLLDTRHGEAMSALTDVRSSLGQGKADRAMLAELFQRLASDVTSDNVN
ncbi:MAG: hypothetical protein SVU69_12280 [Pseudomonadota bacterium]|nr:hypothetical protein [Pseudomonadota bacterium]